MDNINFKKVLDDGELFDQQANYEENFEKINQEVVPKITDLETNKVDKVTGKGLSTNDYTTTEKNKLAGIPADTATQLSGKVDKVVGKQLSDENYTLIEKNKLAGVEENATADMTALEIKTEYESNADTNAYTDVEKAKVANLPADTNAQLSGKVDKVTGKGLSTNDFDNTYKQKIDTDIPAQLADKANKTQESWITASLLNGATGSITYAKNSLGLIILRVNIIVNTSAYNTIQATLPEGYRPSGIELTSLIRNYTVGGVSVQIIVDTSGNIRVLGGVTNGQGIRGTLVFYAG